MAQAAPLVPVHGLQTLPSRTVFFLHTVAVSAAEQASAFVPQASHLSDFTKKPDLQAVALPTSDVHVVALDGVHAPHASDFNKYPTSQAVALPTAVVQVVALEAVHLLQGPEPPYYEYPLVQAFIVVASLHPVLAPVVHFTQASLTL